MNTPKKKNLKVLLSVLRDFFKQINKKSINFYYITINFNKKRLKRLLKVFSEEAKCNFVIVLPIKDNKIIIIIGWENTFENNFYNFSRITTSKIITLFNEYFENLQNLKINYNITLKIFLYNDC